MSVNNPNLYSSPRSVCFDIIFTLFHAVSTFSHFSAAQFFVLTTHYCMVKAVREKAGSWAAV